LPEGPITRVSHTPEPPSQGPGTAPLKGWEDTAWSYGDYANTSGWRRQPAVLAAHAGGIAFGPRSGGRYHRPSIVPASLVDAGVDNSGLRWSEQMSLRWQDVDLPTGSATVTWHALGHTFASRLVAAGVDLRTVQDLGGWRTLSMVQRYAHLSPDHLVAAVEKIAPAPAVVAPGNVSAVELGENLDAANIGAGA